MKFQERLKELRIEQGWTQRALAEKMLVTDDCIHFWEKGRSEPSLEQLCLLADLLEVSTDYLLGKIDD